MKNRLEQSEGEVAALSLHHLKSPNPAFLPYHLLYALPYSFCFTNGVSEGLEKGLVVREEKPSSVEDKHKSVEEGASGVFVREGYREGEGGEDHPYDFKFCNEFHMAPMGGVGLNLAKSMADWQTFPQKNKKIKFQGGAGPRVDVCGRRYIVEWFVRQGRDPAWGRGNFRKVPF